MAATTVYTLAAQLLECARISLEDGGQDAPCRVGVTAGEIAWDSCANGGQLVISVNRVYYSNNFPLELTAETTGQANPLCGPAMAVADYSLSLMRCAPVVSGSPPRAPSIAALDASAREILEDSYYLRTGLLCCLRDLQQTYTIVDYRISTATIDGPIGNCVGNEVQILVGVTNG